ncbi:hypothetical protein Taro_053280 [Colocasia esculenta]|uniref:Uncharacterized protein n=1 Tax=Colocasia esculenta TaxID=4460 RepID=A0A843XM51_COLES|nr:hypothetical protein [Colocasia esculenta]
MSCRCCRLDCLCYSLPGCCRSRTTCPRGSDGLLRFSRPACSPRWWSGLGPAWHVVPSPAYGIYVWLLSRSLVESASR